MNSDASNQDIVTSIRMPLTLREQIDDLRVARARRGCGMPKLRDLVVEALALLVASETACGVTAPLGEPVR